MSQQLIINSIQEDVLASRMRFLQSRISELVLDVETRTITRDTFLQKVKEVERSLRKTREDL